MKEKIVLNKKTNLLEEKIYSYSLQDVKEPQLYRDIFDYENVPKVIFNSRFVPMGMPENIWITDTTFRDGQQSMSPFTVEQIVELFKLMSRLGGKKGIIRQSEFFLYSEKDRKAAEACRQGLPTRKRNGVKGNRRSCQLLGLSHFQKDESYPFSGAR